VQSGLTPTNGLLFLSVLGSLIGSLVKLLCQLVLTVALIDLQCQASSVDWPEWWSHCQYHCSLLVFCDVLGPVCNYSEKPKCRLQCPYIGMLLKSHAPNYMSHACTMAAGLLYRPRSMQPKQHTGV